jgi:hypothetical protein
MRFSRIWWALVTPQGRVRVAVGSESHGSVMLRESRVPPSAVYVMVSRVIPANWSVSSHGVFVESRTCTSLSTPAVAVRSPSMPRK